MGGVRLHIDQWSDTDAHRETLSQQHKETDVFDIFGPSHGKNPD